MFWPAEEDWMVLWAAAGHSRGCGRQLGNMRGGPFRTEDPVFVGHF